MKPIRSISVMAAALVTLIGGIATVEAAFPEKPITMYIAYRAGGSADATARILAEFLEQDLGQPIVSTNKPGGGGSLLATFMKNRKPDGYEIMMNASLTYTFTPQFSKKVKYKPLDFTHITTVTRPLGALLIHPSKKWANLREMIDEFKSRDKAIAFTSQVELARMIASVISNQSGVKFKITPVKGGAAGGQLLLGGHVDMVWGGGWHVKFVRSGQMKVIASLEDKRLAYAQDVPTVQELGFRDIYTGLTFMFSGPPNMPKDVTMRLNQAIRKAVAQQKVMDLYEKKFTFKVELRSPEETDEYIRWETKKFTNFLRAAGAG